ncbi:MAG TPA: DNA polymerase III subunit beta [Pirellulales bacterium]|nr:DNA polymerase III subunit beta [Pirellulales bacterium]
MKVICDREKLLAAFQIASVVAPARSPKPILRNVKFEVAGPVSGDSGAEGRGTLLATDLEVGVRVSLADVQVEAPGSAVLPIDRVGLILRESSDAKLRIESDGQGTLVRGDRSEFKLPAGNPEEFPSIVEFTENKYHALPARVFKELIRRTVFATDTESSRYALGGVLFEMSGDKVTAVGTDGRRLAMMEAPGKAVEGHETGDTMTIVPTKALHFIDRALADGDEEVQIATRANDVLVRSPRVTIYSRLVEGRFPKWRDVFPRRSDAVKIEMVVGPLHSAVRQAAIMTNDESRGVDFTFGDGKVVLSGRGAETGQSRVELPIAYDGASIGITLDPRYVNDFLKVLDPEKNFTLEIKDSESAAVCSTDDGYGYVIMPLARDRR